MVSKMRICVSWLVTDRVLQKLEASREQVTEAKEMSIEVKSEP